MARPPELGETQPGRTLAGDDPSATVGAGNPGAGPVVPRLSENFYSRYRILGPLGQGRMGVVVQGEQLNLSRPVAIKFPLLEDLDAKNRFVREGKLLARISHPNVVRLIDADMDEGVPYVVLEYVDGETLEARLARQGPLPVAEAVALTCQVLDGLDSAHALGMVHRDVKTENVLVTREGRAKLSDFGLARMWGSPADFTDRPVGTPAYMPPEQVRGEDVGPAGDVYSMGVVLFELLTGRPPFEADTVVQMYQRQLQHTAPAVRSIRPEAPPALDALLAAVLIKDPDRRPATAAAFGNLLRTSVGLSREARATSMMDAAMAAPAPLPDWVDENTVGDEVAAAAIRTNRSGRITPPPSVGTASWWWLAGFALAALGGVVWLLRGF